MKVFLAVFQRNFSFVAETIQSSIQCVKNTFSLDYTNCSCKTEHGYHSFHEVLKNLLGTISSENLNLRNLNTQFFHLIYNFTLLSSVFQIKEIINGQNYSTNCS